MKASDALATATLEMQDFERTKETMHQCRADVWIFVAQRLSWGHTVLDIVRELSALNAQARASRVVPCWDCVIARDEIIIALGVASRQR